MKARYAVLSVMLVAFAAVLSQAIVGRATDNPGGPGGIPLPVGHFSSTIQGTAVNCLNPSTILLESCSTPGALVVPLSILFNGALTMDQKGNSCATYTEVDTVFISLASLAPPRVVTDEHSVGTLLNYDSTTGTGESSFINYTGGACIGGTFDSTGATEVSSWTNHFTVTDDGNRSDSIVTELTNPTSGSNGGFSLSGTNLRQTSPES